MKNRWMVGGSLVLLLMFTVGQVFAAEGQAPAADPAAAPAAAAPAPADQTARA